MPMTDEYDLMVIGTGVAGNKVAEKCARYGLNVAISENREMGGTCGLRGCNPKKVLTTAAAAVDQVRRLDGKGIIQDTGIVWKDLMRFKSEFTEHIPFDREESYRNLGIDVYLGETRFDGPHSVEVGGETVDARHFLVATGSRPKALGVPGEELMITSDEFLELTHLPQRMIFIGGGYISFEFAQVAAIAGADVKVITRGSRVLKEFDADLTESMVTIFRDMGIEVITDAPLRSIERDGDSLLVDVGLSSPIESEKVVHGAGREPNIFELNLDAANVVHDERGIKVNGHMQSISNLDVYAAGDVVPDSLPLSPVADMEAFVVGENLVKDKGLEVDYEGIPTVVFTTPTMASVGINEEEANALCLKYRVSSGDLTHMHSSRRAMVRHSGYKVLIEEGTGRILGAHIMGNRAEEVINIFGMAMRHGISAREIKSMPFAFPTDGYDARYMV
jgi:glutathione reductase (NADPH)